MAHGMAPNNGIPITGASMPSGGKGPIGWLSAIWKAITDRLPSALVSGRLDVNVGNTPAVTGTVTANAGTNLNTSSLALETGGNLAATSTVLGATSDAAATQGSTGTVSAKLRTITSQLNTIATTGIPITGSITVGAHAVTNAGTFAVQENGAALTSLQLIDDAIYAVNGAISKSVAIAGQRDDTSPTTATENAVAPVRITEYRGLHVNLRDSAGTELGSANSLLYATESRLSGSTGLASLDSYAYIVLYGSDTVEVSLAYSSWSGTIVFETVNPHGVVNAVSGFNVATQAIESSTAAGGTWLIKVGGHYSFRARCSAYTSGTMNVYLKTGSGLCSWVVNQPGQSLAINDNSGSITVDGTVSVSGAVDTELPAAAALADGASNPTTPLIGSCGQTYNGSTWDMQRGNLNGVALASAARTADSNSGDITNHNARGAYITVDVTAITATPSIQMRIQYKDPASGKYEFLNAAPTAITATGTHTYLIYPGIAVSAVGDIVVLQNCVLPRTFRIFMDHLDADSITYSVGYSLIL